MCAHMCTYTEAWWPEGKGGFLETGVIGVCEHTGKNY